VALSEWIILVVAAGVLAVWVSRAFQIYSPKSRGPVLSKETAGPAAAAGLVSIIMPAKDEEANIGAALETLLAQDYPDIEILVVDDRSRDGTADVVRQVAVRDGRVRLVEVKELAPGWFGKPHAMHVGAGEARGRWLLFVDADCRQAPHSVRAAVNFLAARQGEMLSLWPVLEMHGFWENAVQPVAGSVLVAWFRPSWVNNPKHWAAFANGQYILIRKDTYRAVGGYEAVRSEIVEDIALARLVKRSGRRLWNAIGADLFTTRMYDSLRAMYKGWTRIYYGAFKSVLWLLGVMALTFLFTLVPFGALAWSAAATAAGGGRPFDMLLFALALATTVLLFVTMRRYFLAGRANPWYLFFYPPAVALTMVFQLGAVLRALGLRSVTWRGTTYKGGRVVGGAK
jgi:chlorobactene glucosyltransferase